MMRNLPRLQDSYILETIGEASHDIDVRCQGLNKQHLYCPSFTKW